MIKIPVYQEQVDARKGQAVEPQFSKPNTDAFGLNVIEAQGKMGDAVSNIGGALVKHAEQQIEFRSQQKAYDASAKYKQEMDNLLYSNEPTEITGSDGKKYQAPTGYLVRSGFQTDKQTVEFQTRARELKQKYLEEIGSSPFGGRAVAYADKLLENEFISNREKVLSHEASQMRKAGEAVYQNQLLSKVDEAAKAQSPEDLAKVLNGVGGIKEVSTNQANFKGATPEEALTISQNYAAKAVKAAVDNALLSSGGDLDTAVLYLEKAKADISTEQYTSIYNQATVGANSIKRQAEVMQQTSEVNTGIKVVQSILKNGVTWKDYAQVEAQPIPEKLKQAIHNSITREAIVPGQPLKDLAQQFDDKDAEFAMRVADVMSQGSQQQILESVARIYESKGKSLTQSDADILVSMALQRAANLKALAPVEKQGVSVGKDPALAAQDSGYNAVKTWADQTGDKQIYADYTNFISSGLPPQEAMLKAQRSAFERIAPDHAAKYDGVPDGIVSGNRMTRMIIPKQSKAEPKKIFDPASGLIVDNPKYKAPKIEDAKTEKKNANNSK